MSKARVSIAVIDARASASYQLPVTAIQYIELVAAAEVDTVGRHRYIVDGAAVADERVIAFAKNVQSAALIADALSTIGMLKNLVDSVETSESFEALLVTIVELFSEALISDADLIDFAKNLVDGVSISELVAADYLKPFEEVLSAADLFSAGFETNKSETVSLDGFAGTFGGETSIFNSYVLNDDLFRERITALFNKALFESPGVVDEYDRVVQWDKSYADSIDTAELFYNTFEKPLSDTFTLSDLCVQQLIIERAFNSLATTSDATSVGSDVNYSDHFSVSDSMSYEKIAAPPFLFNNYQFNTIRLNATI